MLKKPVVYSNNASKGLYSTAEQPVMLCVLALLSMLFSGMLLDACASGTESSGVVGSQGAKIALADLRWCEGKPLEVFRDEGGSVSATGSPAATVGPIPSTNVTPTTLSEWSVVREHLGFIVYLPASLPAGACLMSASATLHDPIFGSSFTISYLLPAHNALSVSEAPIHRQNPEFQCSVSSNPAMNNGTAMAVQAPIQLCTGAHKTTNIVFSTRGTPNELKEFFQNLQPDVAWQPTR